MPVQQITKKAHLNRGAKIRVEACSTKRSNESSAAKLIKKPGRYLLRDFLHFTAILWRPSARSRAACPTALKASGHLVDLCVGKITSYHQFMPERQRFALFQIHLYF